MPTDDNGLGIGKSMFDPWAPFARSWDPVPEDAQITVTDGEGNAFEATVPGEQAHLVRDPSPSYSIGGTYANAEGEMRSWREHLERLRAHVRSASPEPGDWKGLRDDRMIVVVDEASLTWDAAFMARARRDSRSYHQPRLAVDLNVSPEMQRALLRAFRVPGRILGLPPESAAERRLRTQVLRTQRRAARRERRARRGR